jgi:hypothetical protein
MKIRMFLSAVCAACVLAIGAQGLKAQPRRARPAKRNPRLEPGDAVKKKRKAKERSRGGLFILEDIKIEGKVYKPQAFHVINRKELNLEWDVRDPRFRKSFLSSLVAAVRKSPF